MDPTEIHGNQIEQHTDYLTDEQLDRVRDIIDVWKHPLSESDKKVSLADAITFEALDSDTKQLIYEYLRIADISSDVDRVNALYNLLRDESMSIAKKQKELMREKALQDEAEPDNKDEFKKRLQKLKDAYAHGYVDKDETNIKIQQIELHHYPQYFSNMFALDHLREQIDDELSEQLNTR